MRPYSTHIIDITIDQHSARHNERVYPKVGDMLHAKSRTQRLEEIVLSDYIKRNVHVNILRTV